MRDRKTSPGFFRNRGTAVAFFVIAAAVLAVGLYYLFGMLTRYDYTQMIPEDAQLRVTLIDENYEAPTPKPTPEPTATPVPGYTPLPTPAPTPQPTPLPIEYYSRQETQMLMPNDVSAAGEAVIQEIKVSSADASRAVWLTGWAYLNNLDAEMSSIYVVISPRGGSVGRRFYLATVLPGGSGVMHDRDAGENLDRADFRCVFDVSTYEEGPYRLGILVVNRTGRHSKASGWFDLDSQYQIYVKSGAVVELTVPEE